MKKVMVCGCGAQGTTICKKLDQEPNVKEIVCADYSLDAAKAVCKLITKGTPKQVNAASVDEIAAAAEGCDLIINVMPLTFGVNVMNAALKVGCCYQDLAAAENVVEESPEYDSWVEGIKYMYTEYSKRFAANDTTALIATGAAPGLTCMMARKAVRELDTCDTIVCFMYAGARSKRFVPFWWSPIGALSDMEEDAYATENGKLVRRPPFGHPVKRKWPECDRELTFVDHSHDEPVHFGLNREKYFKGVNNVYFKYGGPSVEFSEGLYKAGLLSHEEEEFKGAKINPFDWVMAHIPPAPKGAAEIQAIIDEGILEDNAALVVEVYGKKNGKDVMVECHMRSPGLVEAFSRYQMSTEMYLAGQGAFLFTKLFLNDQMPEKGLLSSDMLTDEQVDQYLNWANEIGMTYQMQVKEGVRWIEE